MDNNQRALDIKNKFCGFLEGHRGLITSIVTGNSSVDGKESTILISGSRDKSIMIWKLNPDYEKSPTNLFGDPFIALNGHNHTVNDLSLSTDNNFLLSASWDKSIRLWDLRTGSCIQRFTSVKPKEIFSVTFDLEMRQIFSGGTDNGLSLWNTKGKLMTTSKDNHNDWVSKIRFSPSAKNKFYASVGWDGKLKLWSDFFKQLVSFKAHDGPIYALAINATGSFIATGGKDQFVKIWKITSELKDMKEPYLQFKCDSIVNDVAFNPELTWVAAATDSNVCVWALDGGLEQPMLSIKPENRKSKIEGEPRFTSLAWSSSGKFLYCGTSTGQIHVHHIEIHEGA